MINKTTQGRWRVRVKSRGVVVADRTFTRKGDAVRWEVEQRRLLMGGDFVPPSAGRITVAELAAEYRLSREGQVSTRAWESDVSALNAHILPAFGRLSIDAITPVQVERFLSDLAVRRSIRTAARVRTTVRGLFSHAVRTRRLRISPAAEVHLPRPDSARAKVVEISPFTFADLMDVVAAQREFDARYADLTLVLALTGVRFGELRGLRVKDVAEVPYPSVVVRRSLPQSGLTGAVIERGTTKSGRVRAVPLSEVVEPVVRAWAADREGEELLFPAPGGGYLLSSNWRRAVHWDRTCQGRRPHDLRHTAASLWIAAGVDIKTVSAWLGHSTAKLTLDVYGHLMGTDADRAAISRVNASLRIGPGTSRGRQAPDGGDATGGQEAENGR